MNISNLFMALVCFGLTIVNIRDGNTMGLAISIFATILNLIVGLTG